MTNEILYRQYVREYTSNILSLCKVRISVFATLSAVSGLFLASSPSGVVLIALATGIFLLASGAGTLNHYQERHIDALMARTAGRPLPRGRIKPRLALFLSIFLISAGCAVLLITGRPLASLLGLVIVLGYNGFYTWLKTYSGLAAIPGALVGAIPPAIGWMAGDGNMFDTKLAAICFFFFMWQVLHFLIHVLAYGKEYKKAGLPSLSTIFTEGQLNRLAFQWLLAVAVSAQFIVLFGVIHSPVTNAALLTVSLWLAFQGISFIRKQQNTYGGMFRRTNYYVLMVMMLITLDGLFRFVGPGIF